MLDQKDINTTEEENQKNTAVAKEISNKFSLNKKRLICIGALISTFLIGTEIHLSSAPDIVKSFLFSKKDYLTEPMQLLLR